MAWTLLNTNYTDAAWTGLKKYSQINNDDGTVSFQDVTTYTNKENSFFGAKDANAMNEALNRLMSMVENGTDLYESFTNYFNDQKTKFEDNASSITVAYQNDLDDAKTDYNTKAKSLYDEYNTYITNLKSESDSSLSDIETGYKSRMDAYETQQQKDFNTWFSSVKGQFSGDIAGNLVNGLNNLDAREFNHYYGLVDKTTDISTQDDGSKKITETGDDVTAVTTFATTDTGKVITTVLATASAKYTKTVTITATDAGKNIVEAYTKEVA